MVDVKLRGEYISTGIEESRLNSELTHCRDVIRRWYIPGDEVRRAVTTVALKGDEQLRGEVIDAFIARLREPDSEPDYDHFYQLEDGRIEMHQAKVAVQVLFCLDMLQVLKDPRTAHALRTLPRNARGYLASREYLNRLHEI
jgi:hypothetical protein